MQVQVLSRDTLMKTVHERADRLKSSELSDPGSAAARGVVLSEAARMQAIPGADTRQMKLEIERLRAEQRSTGKKALAVGAAFVAAGGVAAAALSGTPGFVVPIACAGAGCFAFVLAYGSRYNDGFYGETGEMVERWTRVATAPPVAPGQWLQTLPITDPHTRPTKQEMLDLMEASRGYLQANLEQPGHAAALQEVERDLAGLARRPESLVSDIRANMQAENQALRRKMLPVAYCAMGGLIGGLASLPFLGAYGMAAGFLGAAGLATAGQLMLHHEKGQLTLHSHLQGWETQLQSLKDMSAEVHRLAQPGPSAGIKKQAGFLLVGGVRVPVSNACASSAA